MATTDTAKIAPGAYLLAEVRGDGLAALDNFLLKSWPTRLNAWLDNLPGYWNAKLPPTGIDDAAALVQLKAPLWSPAGAMTVGEARRMLSGLVGGVDVKTLVVTGANPPTPAQMTEQADAAKSRSPLSVLTSATETVVAWVVVGLVVAVVLSRSSKS